ncbi:259_t:CDS:2, partial [Acaulospora colombiana]
SHECKPVEVVVPFVRLEKCEHGDVSKHIVQSFKQIGRMLETDQELVQNIFRLLRESGRSTNSPIYVVSKNFFPGSRPFAAVWTILWSVAGASAAITSDAVMTPFDAGGLAGAVAAAVTTPLDVAKTLLQTRGTSHDAEIRKSQWYPRCCEDYMAKRWTKRVCSRIDTKSIDVCTEQCTLLDELRVFQ